MGHFGCHPSPLLNHFSACQTWLLKSSAPTHEEASALASTRGPTVCPTTHNRKHVRAGWVGQAHGAQLHQAENLLTCPPWTRLEQEQVRCHPGLQVSTRLSGLPAGLQTPHMAEQQAFKVQATGNRIGSAWREGYFYTVHFFPFLFICFLYFFFQVAFPS